MATPGQGFRIMGADLPLYGSSPLERLLRSCRDCWRVVFPGIAVTLVLSGPPLVLYQLRAATMRANGSPSVAKPSLSQWKRGPSSRCLASRSISRPL